jgi:hypothetical protein
MRKVLLKSKTDAALQINVHGADSIVFTKKGQVAEVDENSYVTFYKANADGLIGAGLLELEVVDGEAKAAPKVPAKEEKEEEAPEKEADPSEEVVPKSEEKEVKGKGKGK